MNKHLIHMSDCSTISRTKTFLLIPAKKGSIETEAQYLEHEDANKATSTIAVSAGARCGSIQKEESYILYNPENGIRVDISLSKTPSSSEVEMGCRRR